MNNHDEHGEDGNFSLAFFNASILSAQTLFESLIDLVEKEEVEEVDLKRLRRSGQSVEAFVLLRNALHLLADAYLLFQISKDLKEKVNSSPPAVKSEISELIKRMPRIAKILSKTIVKALKYSPEKNMHVEIDTPLGPLLKIDIKDAEKLEDSFEENDEYIPLTGKQLIYLEGLTRSESNAQIAEDYIIKHNRKYLNHMSIREASELIEKLKKK